MSGQLQAPAALSSRKETPLPIQQKAGWDAEKVWPRFQGKNSFLPLLGIEPVVQPVAQTLNRLSYSSSLLFSVYHECRINVTPDQRDMQPIRGEAVTLSLFIKDRRRSFARPHGRDSGSDRVTPLHSALCMLQCAMQKHEQMQGTRDQSRSGDEIPWLFNKCRPSATQSTKYQ